MQPLTNLSVDTEYPASYDKKLLLNFARRFKLAFASTSSLYTALVTSGRRCATTASITEVPSTLKAVSPAGVPSRESRDPAGDGRLPSEKDLSTVGRLLLRVIQSWRLCRPQYRKSVEGQSKTDSECPSRERNLLPLPPLSVAEALPWHQSEGHVDLLTDYAKFTIKGINHL